MRGYEYREFLGHKGFYANAELRFPLIHAMATPIGILGGIRGVFFFNLGGAGLEGQPFKIWDNNALRHRRRSATRTASSSDRASASRASASLDARASYGIGLETFALGFPVHFDWSYRTLFNKEWEELPSTAAAQRSSARRGSPRGSDTTFRRCCETRN